MSNSNRSATVSAVSPASRAKLVISERFAVGVQVRVRGAPEQVRALYGRELVGAVGTIVRSHRRSHGVNAWWVHMPAHDYVSPVRAQVSRIEAFETVLREDHLEEVAPSPIESEVTR